jgi:hypothetical protein
LKSKTSKPLLAFVCRFALLFGLLIIPWPGWNGIYGEYFRALGQMVFSRDEGSRIVLFTPNVKQAVSSTLTTELTLGNRYLLDATGKGLLKRAKLDTRSIGWVPTALTLALIAASPLPWIRRGWALLGGLVLVHFFILFTLQTWIWSNEPVVSLATFFPFGKQVADALEFTFVEQLGASFAVPVLIWIFVSFRRNDAHVWNQLFNRGESPKLRSDSSPQPLRRRAASAVQTT